MIDNNNLQEQIKVHTDSLITSIQLVKDGLWDAQSVLDTVVKPARKFHFQFKGGNQETNEMSDKLFKVINKTERLLSKVQ